MRPTVAPFFHQPTGTWTYVVSDPASRDAAVIDPGKESDYYWVVASDPITFTTDEIGYYGVVVNLNDIATRGGAFRLRERRNDHRQPTLGLPP